jgi:hypothetical protein
MRVIWASLATLLLPGGTLLLSSRTLLASSGLAWWARHGARATLHMHRKLSLMRVGTRGVRMGERGIELLHRLNTLRWIARSTLLLRRGAAVGLHHTKLSGLSLLRT